MSMRSNIAVFQHRHHVSACPGRGQLVSHAGHQHDRGRIFPGSTASSRCAVCAWPAHALDGRCASSEVRWATMWPQAQSSGGAGPRADQRRRMRFHGIARASTHRHRHHLQRSVQLARGQQFGVIGQASRGPQQSAPHHPQDQAGRQHQHHRAAHQPTAAPPAGTQQGQALMLIFRRVIYGHRGEWDGCRSASARLASSSVRS